MRFRLFRAAGIAVVFLGLALWVATTFKLRPRALIALDIPVSLSAGHIETGDFSVEPDRRYYVDIDLEKTRLSRHGCQPATVLATQWELTSASNHIDHGSSPWEDSGLTVAVFCPDERRYSFHAQVLPGADCLNAANPRLRVRTHPIAGDLYTALTWVSAIITVFGFAILVQPIRERFQYQPTVTVLGSEESDR